MTPDPRYWKQRQVCVVGGTGFLGWHLARQLTEAGAQVRIFGLPPRNDHPLIHQSDIEVIFGDVTECAALALALDSSATVFNTAGVVAATRADRDRFFTVHRAAIQNILDLAPPEARIVHTSSVTTLGPSSNGIPVTEDSTATANVRVDYVRAKREAERIALEAAANGRDVVVTNPGFLVGPDDFDRSIMGRICLKFWNGRLPIVPPGGANLVDVRDAAVGHLAAAERGQTGVRYILGGENRSSEELFQLLAKVAELRPRLSLKVPSWGLFALTIVTEARARLLGKSPFPSWQDAQLNGHVWFAASDRAKRELGFRPRPLLESLADSFAWHRDRNLITPRGLRRWWLRAGDVMASWESDRSIADAASLHQ